MCILSVCSANIPGMHAKATLRVITQEAMRPIRNRGSNGGLASLVSRKKKFPAKGIGGSDLCREDREMFVSRLRDLTSPSPSPSSSSSSSAAIKIVLRNQCSQSSMRAPRPRARIYTRWISRYSLAPSHPSTRYISASYRANVSSHGEKERCKNSRNVCVCVRVRVLACVYIYICTSK